MCELHCFIVYVCDEGQCDKESPKICVMRLGITCSLIYLAVVSPLIPSRSLFQSLTSFASLSLTHMRYLLRHHLISFLWHAAVFFLSPPSMAVVALSSL